MCRIHSCIKDICAEYTYTYIHMHMIHVYVNTHGQNIRIHEYTHCGYTYTQIHMRGIRKYIDKHTYAYIRICAHDIHKQICIQDVNNVYLVCHDKWTGSVTKL